MNPIPRRSFLHRSGAAALATTLAARPGAARAQVKGANDAIRLAIVGINGKGNHHIKMFRELKEARIVALCDIDSEVLASRAQMLKKADIEARTFTDYRKLLEDKEIDAVVIATPNHWHSLMGIWACQAGKDVYVEKPVSHNPWEGRRLVEAARKYNRIVQAGTQSRSDEALHEAFAYLRSGALGKITLARGLCYKRRDTIGRVTGPQPIPKTVDYDLFTGPAPLRPLMRKKLHYDWHWVWDTGNGDIGNQGIHEMDMCRWALGERGLPPRVLSVGGRFGYVDDAETPNTQFVVFGYANAPLIFEVRGLPRQKGQEAMDNVHGARVGLVVQCENGFFAGGAGGGWVYDKEGKKMKSFTSQGGGGHQANFLKAVRSRKVEDLAADVLQGHISSALCHLGNISHRLGQLTPPGAIAEALKSDAAATETLERTLAHLKANEVDPAKDLPTLGASLEFVPEKERFVEKDSWDLGAWANRLLTREYRKPFVVPEQV